MQDTIEHTNIQLILSIRGFCVCKSDYLQSVFVTTQMDTQGIFTVIYRLR